MSDLENYFNEIDVARIQRVKELSEVKRIFLMSDSSDIYGVNSKAVVVLAYASWEGFYNECVDLYVRFSEKKGLTVRDVGWLMLVGSLTGAFDSLRDKHHSRTARRVFVKDLQSRLDTGFENFDRSSVQARSNLDFEKLSSNFEILDFSIRKFLPYRVRIDRELVGWRHAVAHGNAPNLESMDVASHIDFVSLLLALVSDHFQEAMLERL